MRSSICAILILFLSIFSEKVLLTSAGKAVYERKDDGLFASSIIQSFGMATGGRVVVDYTLASNFTMTPYNSNIHLVVVSEQQRLGFYQGLGDKDNIGNICESPSLYRKQIYGEGHIEYLIPESALTSKYSTILMQCRYPYKGASVTFDLTVSMQNPRPDGGWSYLPIQHVFIVKVFLAEIIIYTIFFFALVAQLYFSPEWFKKIHYCFLLSTFAQIICISSQYLEYWTYNKTGLDSTPQEAFFSFSRHIADVIIYATVLLLSLGWSLTRDQLTLREQRLGLGTLSLYLILGLFAVDCKDAQSCASLFLITYVVRTIIILGIIVGMNFTVTQLRASLLQSPWTQGTPLQYLRARQYSQFRIAFIIFLLGPTAILLVQSAFYTWKEDWIPYTLTEMLLVLMFFHVGINFSPIHESLVNRAFDGTYNAIHID